jgi:hypothetical protein
MSASLVVLIPVTLLATVHLLCFVGCSFHSGVAPVLDYTQYDDTVTSTAGLVAFWPLNETSGTTATDNGNSHFDGTYTTSANVPYDPTNQSAAATGVFNLNETGIVAGDANNNDPSQRDPCTYFDGGFVNVPWQAALNQPPFTLEAWVRPNWTDQDVQNFPATRVVVASDAPSAHQGFALYATPDNYWAAVVGLGSNNMEAKPPQGSNQTIMLGTTYYLVVTYDGATLTLYVNDADGTPYAQASASGFSPLPSPIPLYIGTGHPDLTTPLLPFNGWIEDVAFYNVVLDQKTIQTHYANGNGMALT